MTTIIRLVGPWPKGFEAEVQSLLASQARIERVQTGTLGAVSWGDIGSLVSAAVAVIQLAMLIWQAGHGSKSAPTKTPSELTDDVKRSGVFGFEVVSVQPKHSDYTNVCAVIRDQTSGRTHHFVASLSDDIISIAVDRNE